MKRIALLSLTAAFVVGCQDTPVGTDADLGEPAFLFSDGAHAGNADFFFLEPLVDDDPEDDPNFDPGEFDPNFAPVVFICALSVTDPSLVTLTTPCAAPGGGFPLTFTTRSPVLWSTVGLKPQKLVPTTSRTRGCRVRGSTTRTRGDDV